MTGRLGTDAAGVHTNPMAGLRHDEFEKRLRDAYTERTGIKRHGIRLPSPKGIEVSGDLSRPTLRLKAGAVSANMQDDKAAFEGWTLALMDWCGARGVVLDWEPAVASTARSAPQHHQRLLYRLARFEELLGRDRFEIEDRARLADLRLWRPGVRPTLTSPSGRDASGAESKPASEAALEKLFARAGSAPRERLMADLGLRTLDRQFPVGVYDGEPRRENAIFTGGKSAIDLLGAGHDGTLWLFELKTRKNAKVGAVSELFFYAVVANDAREGRLAFAKKPWGQRMSLRPTDVEGACRVGAVLFGSRPHPLVTASMLAPLNEGARRLGWPLRWSTLDIRTYLPVEAPTG